jgi:tetratricopeptide (TPR) repeat protein
MRIAAAVLMVSGKREDGLPILLEARERASEDEQRLHLDLALAAAFSKLKRYGDLATVAERLWKAAPNSDTAFQHLQAALGAQRLWEEAEMVARARLERFPGDALATRTLAELASRQGQSEKAMSLWRQLVNAGKAAATDLNSLAWEALVTRKVTPQSIETAQQANLLTGQRNFNVLHTVASLYAEVDQTREARAVILKAMEVESLEEPNDACWYVFARIAEQHGEYQAAAAAYRKVNPPKDGPDTPAATHHLAKRRLDLLIKEKKIKAL